MSQGQFNTAGSISGTSPQVHGYEQPLQLLRTSQTENAVDRSSKDQPLQSSIVSKSQGMTMLQQHLTRPVETRKQMISVPLKLENVGGNIQLVATKSRTPGNQTSLIPVVVSGDEIIQLQGTQSLQKNVLFLANTQSEQTTGSQNLNLTGLLTLPKEKRQQPLQVSKSKTGFQDNHITSTQGNNSSFTGIASAYSVPKFQQDAQSMNSPVYKSKLEKAMAQNLLMQNSSKSSVTTKVSAAPVVSKLSSPQTTSSHQIKVFLGDKGVQPVNTETVSQNTTHGNAVSQNDSSSIKSNLKISKVAEYYKNMVAGKGVHQSEKSVYYQQPTDAMLEQEPVPQYSIVPDVTNFHTNPKIMDVFSVGEATVSTGVEIAANTDTYPALPQISHFPIVHEETVISEKTYEDYGLSKSILSMMWRMREENQFCDAVLFAGSSQIRLHKIVLIGASPEIHQRVATKTVDKELKLVLPSDLQGANVMTFLQYLYNGFIKLTKENVEQIYRLSSIFGMAQLSRHCYDFCKLAKMGHVIIGSPYQEAAKHINKETITAELLPSTVAIDQGPAPTALCTSNSLAAPIMSSQSQQAVKKEVREELEAISSDIDWITNDPSQSNIPIRKRGRNRKPVQSHHSKSEELDVEGGKKLDNENTETISETGNFKTQSNESKERRGTPRKKNEVNRSEYYQPLEYEMLVNSNDTGSANFEMTNTVGTHTDSFEVKGKQAEMIDAFVHQLDSLPDPIVSGKLDESELLKLKAIDDISENNRKDENTVIPSANDKPGTRRFRTRANISVVEAASQMKAKSNDVTSISSPKGRKRKATKKAVGGSAIRRLLTSNIPVNLSTGSGQTTEETAAVDGHGQKIISEPEGLCETMPRADVLADVNASSKGTVKEATENSVEDKQCQKDATLDDLDELSYSPPKKSKLRKSTLEQQDLRDTVYMRPPPKKRTKEIREMMQNEEDGKQRNEDADDAFKVPDDRKSNPKELEKENTSKKIKQKRKRTRIKNDLVLAKVYEIEKMAQSVDAEKIFRCMFCSVEFKYAKRAVTHLIGTHDVDLEDTTEYVSVEKKSEGGNVMLHTCDICGYTCKPKESGTYYIHYHKYFRHQIPLPKGWQAYKCDLCSKEFFTKFQLREHKLIHFEDNPFVCEQCGSGFRSRTCLNSHVFHKHSSVRKHKCPECPKTFKTATQVKVHTRVHTGIKPFLCPNEHCNHRSTTRGNMKLHLTSKHKLNPKTVKNLMEALEESEVGSENVTNEDGQTTDVNNQEMSRKPADDVAAFEVLVQTGVDNNVVNNRVHYGQGQVEVVSQNDVMVSTYSETVTDDNNSILHARDYSIVNQGSAQNQDLEMVLSEDNNMLENQNIPRHVELLIQDAHRFMQHQDNTGQNQYVQDFQQQQHAADNEIQDLRNRLKDQTSITHTFDPSSSNSTTRFGDTSQGLGTHRIVDPHSKEARMMIREAFEGHGSRPLLKSAILHANQERLDVSTRQLSDTSNLNDSTNLLNEAEKLVIDLQDSGSHHIPLGQEDEVVQRLRSQIQQLRESSEQYRDPNITPLFRSDAPVPEILFQNIATQQQTLEPAHFQSYHHTSGSPPAYNSASHGLIPEIETQSNVALAPVSHDETQGQSHALQALQRQGYHPVPAQSSANQYGPDGTIYQGYYQEQYDIENY